MTQLQRFLNQLGYGSENIVHLVLGFGEIDCDRITQNRRFQTFQLGDVLIRRLGSLMALGVHLMAFLLPGAVNGLGFIVLHEHLNLASRGGKTSVFENVFAEFSGFCLDGGEFLEGAVHNEGNKAKIGANQLTGATKSSM